MTKPHLILKKFFLAKQKVNPKYSLRSLARDLELTPSFVSRVLSGKQEIPVQRLSQFAKVLKMDALSLKELKFSIAHQFLNELGLNPKDFGAPTRASTMEYDDRPQTLKEMSVLSPWYNISIMELATCSEFNSDASWIAKRLGIEKDQVQKSLTYLISNGHLNEVDGCLIKTSKKIRLSTSKSLDMVRFFHKSMMELAVKDMQQNTGDKSFERRLITSTSIATNSQNIARAKEKLAETQLEIAEILREGPCDEVFDLTLILFPLTK